MKTCSILIPNRWTFEAIELTVESILGRTDYPDFKIIVCDNSGGAGAANRLDYLKAQEKQGNIKLMENIIRPNADGKMPYGHGENLKVLLKACDTPLAMLFSSGSEVKDPSWLTMLVEMLKTENDLGVAKLRQAENHFQTCWMPFRWIPNWMLLNMELYRGIQSDDDWNLSRISYDEYSHKEMFDNLTPPANPDPLPLQVFRDTGWRLWEKLEYENPNGLRMLPLPEKFCWQQINFFGGIDRNHSRPDHPYVVRMRANIQKNLELLRKE